MDNRQGLKTAWQLFVLQITITAAACLGFGCCFGKLGVVSALAGGMSGITPAAGSAQIFFRSKQKLSPQQWLGRASGSEAIKLILSVVITGAVFYFVEVDALIMLSTWGLTLMGYKILPWFRATKFGTHHQ